RSGFGGAPSGACPSTCGGFRVATRKGRKRKAPSGWAGLFQRLGQEVQREVKAVLDDPARRQVAAVTIGGALSAIGEAMRRRVGVQAPRAPSPDAHRMALAAQCVGVQLPVTRAALDAAYRKRAFDLHPDRGGSSE